MITEQIRYVQHEKIKGMEQQGWTVSDDLSETHHGEYGVLMAKRDSPKGITIASCPPDDVVMTVKSS